MESIDLTKLEAAARGRYERTRLGWSLAGATPVLLVVVAAMVLSRQPTSSALFGGLAFVTGVVLLWRGQSLRHAFWPGVVSGLLPLVLSLAANVGHGCAHGHCSTWCVPACSAGGVGAGLFVAYLATRKKLGWQFWAGASVMSVLTGAMGCACVGASGVLALVIGFAAGLLPQGVRAMLRRA